MVIENSNAKLSSKEIEALVMEVILFLKKWGLWKDVSILANGNMYSYSECRSDYFMGQEQIIFKENVDPSEYTTGPVEYEHGDEKVIEHKDFSNPEHIFEMIYEGPLQLLFSQEEYEVDAKDIGIGGWDYIWDNTAISDEILIEEYGATTLEECLENMKCMSFAEYSQRDREECMYSGWDPLVFDTWEEYISMGGEEGTGLRPLYELYDTYADYVSEMENFEELSLASLAPAWEQMVNDAFEIMANSDRKIYLPELAVHIWNEFDEIINKYGLSYDFAFPWCLTCYTKDSDELDSTKEDTDIMNKNKEDFVFYDVVSDAINPETGEALVNNQGSTMERYNAFRNNKVDYDADSSIEAVAMYEKSFPFINVVSPKSICTQKGDYNKYGLKFELRNKETDGGVSFRGDTINTVATSNREYIKLMNKLQPVNPHWSADDIDWPREALEFIDAYHTPGNFWILPYMEGISVNCDRGIGAAKDYSDLFLLAVYQYYLGINGRLGKYENINLRKVLNNKVNTVRFFEIYLKSFIKNEQEDIEIYPCGIDEILSEKAKNRISGWKEFIDNNFLQDYVEVDRYGNYGMPKELWKGHFDMFNATSFPYPKTEAEFIEFWTNALELIINRGGRIYETLHSEA